MKYRAIRDSHGYQGRYWTKGDEVDVADGAEKPPVHFVPITEEGTEGETAAPAAEQPAAELDPEAPPEEPDAEPSEKTDEPEVTESDKTRESVEESASEPEPAVGKAQPSRKPPIRRKKRRAH